MMRKVMNAEDRKFFLRKLEEYRQGLEMERVRTILAVILAAVAALLLESLGPWRGYLLDLYNGKPAHLPEFPASFASSLGALLFVWNMWLYYAEILVFVEELPRAYKYTRFVAGVLILCMLLLEPFPELWLLLLSFTSFAITVKLLQTKTDLRKVGPIEVPTPGGNIERVEHPFVAEDEGLRDWIRTWLLMSISLLLLGGFYIFIHVLMGREEPQNLMLLKLIVFAMTIIPIAGLAVFVAMGYRRFRERMWGAMVDYWRKLDQVNP